jgi:hypothetical protein
MDWRSTTHHLATAESGGLRCADPFYDWSVMPSDPPVRFRMSGKFEWPKAESEGDETILRHIRNHGCSVVDIPDADPPFSFSVGLFGNYGHPELIIFGQRSDDACILINLIRDRAAAGHRFADGEIADDILLDGYKLCFWNVPLLVYPKYLGTAIWFYRKSGPFPCLQIIWPDLNRRFPWEAECIPEVKADQPLLKKMDS